MKKHYLELISNMLIFLLVVAAVLWIFLNQNTKALAGGGIDVLKYFTVQSNILVGGASLMSFILLLRNKYTDLYKLIKFVCVAAVTLTFVTVLVYLTPLMGFLLLVQDANSLLHIVIPVIAIIHLFLLESEFEKPNFVFTLYSMTPMFIYGIGYFINLIARNGYGDYRYDFYAFGKFGLGFGILAFFLMMLLTYAIGVGLYFGYTKINIKPKIKTSEA